jgi:hypothetical protein
VIEFLFRGAFEGALDGIHMWDHVFRWKLQRLVPNLRELIEHPADVLSYQELRIGPCRRYVMSTLLGLLAAFCGGTALLFFALGCGLENKSAIRIVCLLLLFTMPVVCIWGMLHLTRGGEIFMTRGGVEFRYRRKSVVCPWAVFNAPGDPAVLAYDRLAVPVSAAVEQVMYFRDDSLMQMGLAVFTPQFRMRPFDQARVTGHPHNWEVVLVDYYKGRLDDIACLLLVIGRELERPVTGRDGS